MTGTLYLIGTPIGNLEDMTFRQIRMLQSVDFIAAEDTRVTRKLLTHYDIHTPMVSYHDHSGQAITQQLAQRILAGETCGIVTDAGMPCISDPGELLVKECHALGIPVSVVPGPSAVVSALAMSGQSTGRFAFEGFLSVVKKQRTEHLEQLRTESRTMIFYEAPHKLIRTLQDMAAYFGEERGLSICRELTKIHEEIKPTTIGEALAFYETVPPKGEFVLVVAGCPKQTAPAEAITLEQAVVLVQKRVAEGMRLTEACKEVAGETGLRKQQLYQAVSQNEFA